MSITTIKIRNREYNITEDDQFLHDTDAGVTILTTRIGRDYEDVVLTKKMVKHINQFPQIEHKTLRRFSDGCPLFSIRAKDAE